MTVISMSYTTGWVRPNAPTHGSVKAPGFVLEVVTRRMMAGVLVTLYALNSVLLTTMTRTTMWFGTMEVQETGMELQTTLIQSK